MFSLTVTVPTASKLVEVAKVLEDAGVEVGTVEASTEAPKGKLAKVADTLKDKKADKEPEAKAAPKAKGISDEEKAKLYVPVKEAALKLSKEKGRDVLVRVLGAFDAKTAPELSVEQYDDFVNAANEELMV